MFRLIGTCVLLCICLQFNLSATTQQESEAGEQTKVREIDINEDIIETFSETEPDCRNDGWGCARGNKPLGGKL